MKSFACLILSLLLIVPRLCSALSVGPDNFGYISIDSTEQGGPEYSFVDISSTGTRLTFFDADNLSVLNADDGVATNISLASLNNGNGFKFYGSFYNTVHMSTNGFLTFTLNADTDSSANQCPAVNSINPDNAIYALWDDLVLSNPSSTVSGGYVKNFAACPYAGGGAGACVVFQWDNADHFGGAIDSFDFQIVLYANNNILMNFGPNNPEQGSQSSTGLENDAGSDGLTHACNSSASILGSSSILFTPNGLKLSLQKTVELDSGTDHCATQDSVTISAGQAVRSCFTITNTGALPVTAHSLIDDLHGTILNNLPYFLSPGSSAYITQVASVNSSITASATWTGQRGALSTFASDSATIIVDDGNGDPDPGDNCPLDPNKVTPGQCGCGVADIDTDGDGALDCVDQCPANSGKIAPGQCGCSVPDTEFCGNNTNPDSDNNSDNDSNNDGIADPNGTCSNNPLCHSTEDLRLALKQLLSQVNKLRPLSAQRKLIKPKQVKATLQSVLIQINQSSSSLQINAGSDINVLRSDLEKSVKKALKIGSASFAKNKKRAKKALNNFLLSVSYE